MKNISQKSIYLFCQYFPYQGGEQFLFNETEYYPTNFEINVFTEHNKSHNLSPLPDNFKIHYNDFKKLPSVKMVLKNYWKLIIQIFIFEILNSPHRFKYIKDFKTHFFLLLGYFQKAIIINEQIPTNKNTTLYSYWFDEWATVIHLVKRIRNNSVNIICRVHGYDFDEAQVNSGYHPFRAFNLNGFDKVISVSNYGKQYIKDKYNFKNVIVNKIGVRENGINPFKENDKKVVVSCSALIPLKRIELIIEILSHLKLEIEWVHFGTGPLEHEILERARSLPSNIKFSFMGFVDNKSILDFYRNNSIDMFINTSIHEGIPVSLMEAISFGIPIVGCNICGVPEIVNNSTGMLLERNFVASEIAVLIESFIINKCSNRIFRLEVKKFWQENFNADTVFPIFIESHLLN